MAIVKFLSLALEQPYGLRARRWIFQVHLWTGLIAGLHLALLGITGSLTMFRDDVARARYSEAVRVTPEGGYSLERSAQALLREYPAGKILAIHLSGPRDESLEVGLNPKPGAYIVAYVDPYRARVLATRRPKEHWFDLLVDFHTNLLSGRTGRVINGVAGGVLFMMALTGIFVWWPGTALWLKRIAFPGRGSKRFSWDLHNATGFWSAVLLAMFGFTAVYFAWHGPVVEIVHRLTGARPRPAPPPARPGAGAPLPLDALLAAARAALPEGRPTILRPGSRAVVQFRAPGDFHNLGNNEVHLDARTGEVLRVDRWREASFGQKAAACLGPTHAGEFGGTPVKLIWAGLGLILPVLFASGAWMWWKRVLRPKLRRAPLRAQAVGKA